MLRRIILKRVRIVMLVVGVAAGAMVLGSLCLDEGELVVLATTDEASRNHETQLWVVALDGRQYPRAASPRAGWLARLEAEPLVVLTRGDEPASYFAHPRRDDSDLRVRVNGAMSAKYGFPDRVISYLTDRELSVPIELEVLRENVVSKVGTRNAR